MEKAENKKKGKEKQQKPFIAKKKTMEKSEVVVGFEKEEEEPIVEVRNGLEFIQEYTHVFRSYTKRRWVGRSIYEVFSGEFKAFSKEYYVSKSE